MRLAYRPLLLALSLLTVLPATLAGSTTVSAQSPAAAGGIQWESDLRAAHTRATAEGKHLLLHFYSDNCVWCDRLEAGAYQTAEVVEAINQNYVALKIHAGHNPELASTFRVSRFPSDVIVTTEGTALVHRVSPQAAEEYVSMLAAHLPAVAADPSAAMLAQQQPSPATQPDPTASPPPTGQSAAAAAAPSTAAVPTMPVSHRSQADASSLSLPAPTKPQPQTLAMDGYCAVSLLEKNQWVEGNPEHGVIHLGQLYLFVDGESMQRFLADPEPFTPVLNGIDVVRFFEEKRIVPGKREFGVRDPQHNRMFFFADEAARVHFENQFARYAEAAISVTRQAAAEANP